MVPTPIAQFTCSAPETGVGVDRTVDPRVVQEHLAAVGFGGVTGG